MKVNDIVFYVRSGIIGWEKEDNTLMFSKNKPYTVDSINGDKVRVASSLVVHKDHFEVREVEGGEIQGLKVFKPGDKVKLLIRGMIEWEQADYTISDKLIEEELYEVRSYILDMSQRYVILNKGSAIHPNHFIKVEDGNINS